MDIERVDGAVWTMRNGKGIRLDYYGSKVRHTRSRMAEALAAVGLRE